MVIRHNNMRAVEVHDLGMLSREQRLRGVLLVASLAADAADCRELLDALGLDPADGRRPVDDGPADYRPGVDPRDLIERIATNRPER